MKPLVVAARELLWLGRGSVATGLGLLGAGLLLRSPFDLTALEAVTGALVFGLFVAGAGGSLVLGVRSGPAILYRRTFERAPAPPADVRGEGPRATALRAVGTASIASIAVMTVAVVALAVALLLFGEPRNKLLTRLPQLALLVGAGWMLVLGTIALWVAVWFRRWERRWGKVLICPRRHSGLLGPIYYVVPGRAS